MDAETASLRAVVDDGVCFAIKVPAPYNDGDVGRCVSLFCSTNTTIAVADDADETRAVAVEQTLEAVGGDAATSDRGQRRVGGDGDGGGGRWL
jgi:hypothetical protein